MSGIGFKNLNVFHNMVIHQWYPQLIGLMKWLLVRVGKDHIIVTSAYRDGDKGVHGQIPLRGLDLRSSIFDNPQKICDDINAHWQYDTDRPEMVCAILHDVGKGMHIHLQVHPRTKYLGG